MNIQEWVLWVAVGVYGVLWLLIIFTHFKKIQEVRKEINSKSGE